MHGATVAAGGPGVTRPRRCNGSRAGPERIRRPPPTSSAGGACADVDRETVTTYRAVVERVHVAAALDG
jgi:hypothetical protein